MREWRTMGKQTNKIPSKVWTIPSALSHLQVVSQTQQVNYSELGIGHLVEPAPTAAQTIRPETVPTTDNILSTTMSINQGQLAPLRVTVRIKQTKDAVRNPIRELAPVLKIETVNYPTVITS
uniref:Uncharacterized protein n=1 Tax=Cacopsylla melanoneura TaxID=428564 RepID=A0A8D8TNX2_9HEMI